MGQDFGVVAARRHHSLSQGGQAVEGAGIVNLLGQTHYLWRAPGWVKGYGAEGIAEDVTKKITMFRILNPVCRNRTWQRYRIGRIKRNMPRNGHRSFFTEIFRQRKYRGNGYCRPLKVARNLPEP